jgi:hypothetical protein
MNNETRTARDGGGALQFFPPRRVISFAVPAWAGLLILLLVSCPEPVPLYGTWADNRGNIVTFISDGSFNAVITNTAGLTENISGSFSVLLNSLAMRIPDQNNRQIVTEWDIRGNMLYLDWTDEYGTVPLTLYKVG